MSTEIFLLNYFAVCDKICNNIYYKKEMICINTVLLGNIFSFFATVLFILMGITKTRDRMLTLQLGQATALGVSNIILGAYTGAAMNFVVLARNFLCLKVRYTLALKIVISAILVFFGLYTNNHGLLGCLPITGTVLCTCLLDAKNVVVLKCAFIISCTMWAFYDFTVQNYVSCATDIFAVISNIIGIINVRRSRASSEETA